MKLSPARFQINTEHPLPPPVITLPAAPLSIAETTASTSSASDENSEPRNIADNRKCKSISGNLSIHSTNEEDKKTSTSTDVTWRQSKCTGNKK